MKERRQETMCPPEEGKARQEFADAVDLNKIVSRMMQGEGPGQLGEGVFADMTELSGGLHVALERVRKAEAIFGGMPAAVRAAFDNDVVKYTEAFESEEGIAKLRELKVIPETEESLVERREAAAEERAVKRAEVRARVARVKAAESPPVEPPSSGKGA